MPSSGGSTHRRYSGTGDVGVTLSPKGKGERGSPLVGGDGLDGLCHFALVIVVLGRLGRAVGGVEIGGNAGSLADGQVNLAVASVEAIDHLLVHGDSWFFRHASVVGLYPKHATNRRKCQ